MALTRTTLSAAVALGDKTVILASITGLQVGMPLIIDREEMRVASVGSAATDPVGVTRGVNGTAAAAHVVTAGAVFGPAADFSTAVPPVAKQAPRQRVVTSYSAAGAIDIPAPGTDVVAILNSTVALAMTLAVPGKANDGDRLVIVGNGKAAHTVTLAGGMGAGSTGYTINTFDTNAQCAVEYIAANSVWVPCPSPFSGTLTGVDVAVS